MTKFFPKNFIVCCLFVIGWLVILTTELSLGTTYIEEASRKFGEKNLIFFATIYFFFLVSFPVFILSLISLLPKNRVRKIISVCISLIFGFLYFLYIFLLLHRIVNKYTFDFFFFWYNRVDAFLTFLRVFGWGSVLLLTAFFLGASAIFYHFFIFFQSITLKKRTYIAFLSGIFMIFSLFFFPQKHKNLQGEITNFFSNIFPFKKSEYIKLYLEYVENYDPERITRVGEADLLGDHIFFIHLESVNGFLINSAVTPRLLDISKEGVFFQNFYANSMQTVRSQENILCGLPPTISNSVVDFFDEETIQRFFCIPEILKEQGYQTFFFKDDRLGFANTDVFMKLIGFEELHSEDIMGKDDPKGEWGFREDIFLKRAFEYLQKQTSKKTFAYIALSSTNHFPFTVHESFNGKLPIEAPKNITEKLMNSTYVQDFYLGNFFDALPEPWRETSSFFIFSDNSYPLGMHEGNNFVDKEAYDENFRVFFTFLPPTKMSSQFNTSKIVDSNQSQMDIMPTLLQLSGYTDQKLLLGNSFADHLLKNKDIGEVKKNFGILAIQPFGEIFIAYRDFPKKYIFNLTDKAVTLYNLKDDPYEKNPVSASPLYPSFEIINDFFTKKADWPLEEK